MLCAASNEKAILSLPLEDVVQSLTIRATKFLRHADDLSALKSIAEKGLEETERLRRK